MDSFRLDDSELLSFALWRADRPCQGHSSRKHMQLSIGDVPEEGFRTLLDELGRRLEPDKAEDVWWSSLIIQNRDDFRGVGIGLKSEHGAAAPPQDLYLVVLARQGSDP